MNCAWATKKKKHTSSPNKYAIFRFQENQVLKLWNCEKLNMPRSHSDTSFSLAPKTGAHLQARRCAVFSSRVPQLELSTQRTLQLVFVLFLHLPIPAGSRPWRSHVEIHLARHRAASQPLPAITARLCWSWPPSAGADSCFLAANAEVLPRHHARGRTAGLHHHHHPPVPWRGKWKYSFSSLRFVRALQCLWPGPDRTGPFPTPSWYLGSEVRYPG